MTKAAVGLTYKWKAVISPFFKANIAKGLIVEGTYKILP